MAVPIRLTEMMPMTIPSVVSEERSLLARMASQAILRPSKISRKKVISTPPIGASLRRNGLRRGKRAGSDRFIAGNQAVADANDAAGMTGDIFLVSDYDD